MLVPCKINLGLEIHHRRESDGYHLLSSIFVPISFGDRIEFEAAEADEILTQNELPPHCREDFEKVSERGDITKNLLWKILEQTTPLRKGGLRIRLQKIVPTGAGLGGGSADAAALLRFIRDNYGAAPEQIFQIALAAGADIPFFLQDKACLVGGIGDILQPLDLGPARGVLCTPNIMANTQIAYHDLKRPLQSGNGQEPWSLLTREALTSLSTARWEQLSFLKNDFEGVIFARHPYLAEIKKSFYSSGADYASMSGSGTALYGLVRDEKEQNELLENMRVSFPELSFIPFQFEIQNNSEDAHL